MNLEDQQIISEGLSALASINESCHAVSTKNRFRDFCCEKEIRCLETDLNFSDLKEGFDFGDQQFDLYEEFRQTGYGAWHIGSAISELRKQGKNILIINGKRNRRFIMIERGLENGKN